MMHLRILSLSILLLVSQATFAANDDPILLKSAFGGASGFLTIGTDNKLGVVVGQSYALANLVLEDSLQIDSALQGNVGYWIEVVGEQSSAIQKPPTIDRSSDCQVRFQGQSIEVRFQTSIATTASISLIDLSGRQLFPVKHLALSQGITLYNISPKELPETPQFLVITIGQTQRTYRYMQVK